MSSSDSTDIKSLPSAEICIDENFSQEVRTVIVRNLKEYNQSVIGPYTDQYFSICARDADGKILGGLFATAFTNYDCLVHVVSVEKQYRGQGLGRKIFGELEDYARKHNCTNIRLDTALATGFYEKLGFREIAKFDGYLGQMVHMMRKDLL